MIELLAPAGSRDALVAAVHSGANAIYLGGKAFGARQYAPNFSDDELAEVVRYAHLYGVKIYVTVNTLVDDEEMTALQDYLRFLYNIAVDAIIVQDVGVAMVAKKVVPKLPLHASTQMTAHNLAGVVQLKELGFKRVVLARELSLSAINTICRESGIEIEVFVHGALCICYSGQCLMSSLIGGRSGNRGRCAQPCRLPYTLVDANNNQVLASGAVGEYLLSPRDLNTLDLLPQLIEAGVTSFKIEGRMKRAEYVAVVVDAYRRAVDAYIDFPTGYEVKPKDQKDLAQIFNRDFTSAYLVGKQGKNMMSDKRPNNRGVYIGRVVKYDGVAKQVVIKLEEDLYIGDGVEFWVKVGGRVGITIDNMLIDGKNVDYAPQGSQVAVFVPSPVRVSDRVFRTLDIKLMKRAQAFFGKEGNKKNPVNATVMVSIGQPLSITLTDDRGNSASAQTNFIAEQAKKRPLTQETIIAQMDRMGNTVFILQNLECDILGEVMVPLSEINDVRRRAVELLESMRLQNFARTPVLTDSYFSTGMLRKNSKTQVNTSELSVSVDSVEKIKTALSAGADWIIFGGENYSGKEFTKLDYEQAIDWTRKYNKKIIFSTPRIMSEESMDKWNELFAYWKTLQPDGVSVSNIGSLYLARKYFAVIHGDFSLNVFNSAAIAFYRELGVTSLTLSPELTLAQIAKIMRNDFPLECIVHGNLPMMVSEFCLLGSYLGDLHMGSCQQPCRTNRYYLRDRMDELFPVVTDQDCRMHILNAKELVMLSQLDKLLEIGVAKFRIEGKFYTVDKLRQVVTVYRDVLARGKKNLSSSEVAKWEQGDMTRGHYFRGVL